MAGLQSLGLRLPGLTGLPSTACLFVVLSGCSCPAMVPASVQDGENRGNGANGVCFTFFSGGVWKVSLSSDTPSGGVLLKRNGRMDIRREK